MPEWMQVALPLCTLLAGTGGGLAWVRYFRSDAPQADATVITTLADAKLKEAQATEVIAQAFTQTLGQVRQLAEDRKAELDQTRDELASTKKDLESTDDRLDATTRDVRQLTERLDRIEHFYTRGAHADWDDKARDLARRADPTWPDYPPFPGVT